MGKVIVVYDSLTGQGEWFSKQLGVEAVSIHLVKEEDVINNKILLVTRCINYGSIPEPTINFLEDYVDTGNIVATAVNGNRNWGENFAVVGDKVEALFNIPCIHKFEGMGMPKDAKKVRDYLNYLKQTPLIKQ